MCRKKSGRKPNYYQKFILSLMLAHISHKGMKPNKEVLHINNRGKNLTNNFIDAYTKNRYMNGQ